MATVLDVAKYVIRKKHPITTMKLQKLVYYCQAWSLVWDEKPLFLEDFEAWANGPICPLLYARHREIFELHKNFLDDIPDYDFTQDEIETMDAVIRDYGDMAPHELSELTHLEHPWRLARSGVPMGAPSNNIITKESMQQYYGGLYRDGQEKETR